MMTFEEATRRLYLQITSGASTSSVVLGVLEPGHGVTQHIVGFDRSGAGDAPAAQVLTPAEALRLVAGKCRTSGARMCGWPRSIVAALPESALEQDVQRQIVERYESSVDLAYAWAATYTDLAVANQLDGSRDQLHRFLRLAGYHPELPAPSAARAGRRHHQGMARGWSSLGADTESAWGRHLDENRHDCLGVRHLVLRATVEMEKRAAYLDSVYSVRADAGEIEFHIDSRTPALDTLMRKLGAVEWAHVSACNPGLATLPAAENARRSAALTLIARQRGYTVLEGAGQDRARSRSPEATQFIVGMPIGEARVLARQFGQWAIVAGAANGAATLEWCLERGADALIVNQLPTLI